MKKSRETETFSFDEEELKRELIHSAKAVGLALNTAETVAQRVAERVTVRLEKRAMVTIDDFNRFVATEAEKYSKDLAYVYKNRGKII